MDRLTSSPQPASVCSNCGGYMLPPRCARCGWVPPAEEPVKPAPSISDDTGEFEPLVVPKK